MSEKSFEPARHEPSDVGERLIWIGSGMLAASVVFLAIVVLLLFPHALTDRTLHLPLPSYPAPRQQTDSRAEMQKFYAAEMQWLNGAGWVDKATGSVHIPIAEAMRITARENIPGWPAAPEEVPAAQAETQPPAPPMETAHEAAPSSTSVGVSPANARSISAGPCGARAGPRRGCLRAKARKPAPHAGHVARRDRANGTAR
jgi:hypothetical protein